MSDTSGQVYRSRTLVVAVPPEQASPLLRGVPLPPLPDCGLLPCLAVMVDAPGRLAYDAVFVESPSLQWAASNTSKLADSESGRALWTLHSTPALAQQALAGDEAAATDELRRHFAALMALDEHQVGCVHTHRWRYARRDSGAPAGPASWAVAPLRLALAGDWLADGRVEGAWLSGRAAAEQLAQGGLA